MQLKGSSAAPSASLLDDPVVTPLDSVASTLEPDLTGVAERLRGRRVLVLSGAGISTESGIPDYRGPQSLQNPPSPMRYAQFVGSEAARQRYWSRSFVGWARVAEARPNRGHRALAQLGAQGVQVGLITQNVDGLHQAAGSRGVLELHGSLAAVRCLGCRRVSSRRRLQEKLRAMNPVLEVRPPMAAPDGDAELPDAVADSFQVPACEACGGVLKPDVVFFGENVPAPRVALAYEWLTRAEVLLVVGSSLTVFSGYRFVVRAVREGKPVVILNQGPTRGDADAALKVGGRLGELLPILVTLLAA